MRTPSFQTVDVSLTGPIVALLLVLALPAAAPSPGTVAPSTLASEPAHSTGAGPAETSVASAPASGATPSGLGPGLAPRTTIPIPPVGRAADGLTVSILQAPPTVDVGVEVGLTGQALGGEPPYTPEWALPVGVLEPGWSIRWTAPSVAGSFYVMFEVRDRAGVVATTMTTIHVVPGPFLELSGIGRLSDVGLPFLFAVNVSGGVGPFSVHWSSINGTSNGSSTFPADGTYTGAIVPEAAGSVWVTGSIVDAWNRSYSGTAPIGRATAPPALTPASVPFAEVGYPTPITVGVADGTPPLTWSVPAVAGVSAVSSSGGMLETDGTVSFSVTFDHGGNYTLPVHLVDAAGAVDGTNVSVLVADGLNLSVALGSPTVSVGEPVDVLASISGGLPPYAYRLAFSDNEETSGNASVAGPVRWTATPAASGYLTLRGSVTDGTGRVSNVTLTVYVAPSTGVDLATPGSGGTFAAIGAVVGAVVALLGGFALRRWWRWPLHRPSAGSSGSAERTVVRELLAEADDGIDRATLELLAEERHVSSDAVATAVSSWQRAGRVRIEAADDGREVVHWVAAPRTSAPENAAAAEAGRQEEEP